MFENYYALYFFYLFCHVSYHCDSICVLNVFSILKLSIFFNVHVELKGSIEFSEVEIIIYKRMVHTE